MPIIGQFGKLSGIVTPDKGTRFSFEARDILVPTGAGPQLVGSFTIPVAPGTCYINLIIITGPSTCYAELKRDDTVLWQGRSAAGNVDIHRRFDDAELLATSGQMLSVYLEHWYRTPLSFSVQLLGFRR